MTAHIVNKSLDETKIPAKISKREVTGMLRNFLGYGGVIISDDMQMGAINNEYGLKDAIKMSLKAGVDMLMFANNVKDYDMVTASDVHEVIKGLVMEGILSKEQIESSYQRIMKLKMEFLLLEEDFYKSLRNNIKSN
jgi:beta-N-acetylhexosaminidase